MDCRRMRERAAELKGELKDESATGNGAEISLSVPLSGEWEKDQGA